VSTARGHGYVHRAYIVALEVVLVKRWQIVTHMVMSIISAVASSVQLSLAVAAAAWDIYDLDYFGCYYFVGPYRPGSKVDVRYLAYSLA